MFAVTVQMAGVNVERQRRGVSKGGSSTFGRHTGVSRKGIPWVSFLYYMFRFIGSYIRFVIQLRNT